MYTFNVRIDMTPSSFHWIILYSKIYGWNLFYHSNLYACTWLLHGWIEELNESLFFLPGFHVSTGPVCRWSQWKVPNKHCNLTRQADRRYHLQTTQSSAGGKIQLQEETRFSVLLLLFIANSKKKKKNVWNLFKQWKVF